MKSRSHSILIVLVSIFVSLQVHGQNHAFEWVKQIGGTGNDGDNSIATDNSGNVYTTGWFSGVVDFDPGPAVSNLGSTNSVGLFVQKLDINGNFLWAIDIEGFVGPEDITLDDNDNIYIIGSFSGSVDFNFGPGHHFIGSNSKDIFILKISGNGNFLWAKAMQGNHLDQGFSISVDMNGNVFTTGEFFSNLVFDVGISNYVLNSLGDWDAFIQKLDSNGNFLWAKQIGGGYMTQVLGKSLVTDANGNIYTTGHFYDTTDFDPGSGVHNLIPNGSLDMYILKLNSNGNFLWVTQTGGPSSDGGNYLTVDNSGNIYCTGYFADTVDFDPGISTFPLISSGNYDIFIQKLDPNGNFVWAKQIGGSGADNGISMVTDSVGSLYTIGDFAGIVDFDPGGGLNTLSSFGSTDIFILKLDLNGNFEWAKQMGGLDEDFGRSIAIDHIGNVYSTGVFQGTSDFNPGVGISNLTSAGYYDIFIQKMQHCSHTTATDSVAACNSFTWIDGNTYTSSNNTAVHYLTNSSGCDSIISLFLDFNVTDITTSLSNITISANNALATYQWLDCDNNFSPIIGETSQSFTAISNGNYAVQINENGCIDTSACVAINNVGGIEYNCPNYIVVYPNPTAGQIVIEFENIYESITVRLLSVHGQEVINKKFEKTNTIEFEVDQISGVYLLEISNNQGMKSISKIVIE